MNIHNELKEAGLHPSESTVYLYLLENGLSTPPQIAKATKIARTNCYHIFQSLKEKGLIEEQTKGKRKVYLANDPESIARSLERKKEAINRLLPDLRALYTTQKNKPKIRFYDGLEQIKEIYRQTLSAKEVFGIGSTEQLSNLDPNFFSSYLKDLQTRGVVFHDLLSHASKEKSGPEMQSILKGLYELRYLPKEHHDFPTDILIWDNNVALITLEEPIFGTILTNPLLSKTFKIMFEVMWKSIN